MATALALSNDISESCPLEFKEKVNSETQKGLNDSLSDRSESFLLTLLNLTVCSNCPPFSTTILGQNGVNFEKEGTHDGSASLTGSVGKEVLNSNEADTGKDIDTPNLMNMIIIPADVPVITSDEISEENVKNIKLINDGSMDVPVRFCIENADKTSVNLYYEDGNKAAKTKGAIIDKPKMETETKTLISFTDEAGESNETDGNRDLTCNIAGKKETNDNLKIFIDPEKYQSPIKIDKGISDQPEKNIENSAIRSLDGENHGGNVDENGDMSGENTVQNENKENIKFMIDRTKNQFATKDQKIHGEEGKKPAEGVAARSGEVQSQGENGKGNNYVEGYNATSGRINDFEKYGLGVEKIWFTVNNQKGSNESNQESISPKNQQETLSDKTIGNILKSDCEKFAGNSDKDDSTKEKNHEKNEKTLKGPEFAEPVKINKSTGEAKNEYTITNILTKKVLSEAIIHLSKDQEIETDKNIESQLFTSRQSDIKNSEVSTQTKSMPINDRLFQSSILSQVIDKTSVTLKNGLNSMEIRLKPETLGNIRMHVSTDDNQVSIKIITEGQLVKEIIESNIIQLKSELQSQGMEVTKVEVVADYDRSHDKANYGHSKSSPADNKKDNENILGSIEQWEIDHEGISNEGRISFFA